MSRSTSRKQQPMCCRCPWWDLSPWGCSHCAEIRLAGETAQAVWAEDENVHFWASQALDPACFSSAFSHYSCLSWYVPATQPPVLLTSTNGSLYKFSLSDSFQHEPWHPCLRPGLACLLQAPQSPYGSTYHTVLEVSVSTADFLYLSVYIQDTGMTS